MGDNLVDDWEGAAELDCFDKPDAENENISDGEYELEDEPSNKEANEVDERLMKKKRKLEEALQKRKTKGKAPTADTELTSGGEESKSLSTESMVSLIRFNRPHEFRRRDLDNDFTEADFFCPELTVPHTVSKTKKPCPFVRALSVALPSYKKLLLNDAQKDSDSHGCPVLIIICSSAVRATEVIKSISSKLIKVKIAKLFAKHFKIEEQVELLSKSYYPIAIGTPNRMKKLLEYGALKFSRARIVLCDMTLDAKKFSILTLPSVKEDFYSLLYSHVYPEKSHLKLSMVT